MGDFVYIHINKTVNFTQTPGNSSFRPDRGVFRGAGTFLPRFIKDSRGWGLERMKSGDDSVNADENVDVPARTKHLRGEDILLKKSLTGVLNHAVLY